MKVLVVGDTHMPWHDKKALTKIYNLVLEEKPNVVVQIGDNYDFYTLSTYAKTLSIKPSLDIKKAITEVNKFWQLMRTFCPKGKFYQLMGNHEARFRKRILERLPQLEGVADYNLKKCPWVNYLKSERCHLTLDNVVYTHGWYSKSIDHARHFNKPVVHGHRHRPTIDTLGKLWSMDVGHIANERSLPLSYTQSTVTNWRKACGIVTDGVPKLILL